MSVVSDVRHPDQFPVLEQSDWEGRVGDRSHLTRREMGTVPTHMLAGLQGAVGEEPGQHRNKHDEEWEDFKGDIAEHGIKRPIFVTVDYDEAPLISEGNHRRDAAVELGHGHVPVEVVYFGHAEKQGSLAERMRRE